MNAKTANQKGFSIIEALLILVVIGILGFIGWFVYNKHHKPTQNVAVSSSSTVPPNPKPSIPPPPSYTTTTLNGLMAHVVTLPVKQTPSCICTQNSAITTSGRYVAEDTDDYQNTKVNEGGKLIYDGTVVYNGPYLTSSYALSDNGMHYIYVLDTNTSHSGGKYEVYVDGKLKQTYDDTHNDVTNLAVSNDGTDYAYLLGDYGTNLVKDGKSIYTSSSNMIADFSSDLSKYIVATGTNTDAYGVIVNGQQVASNVTFNGTILPSIAISENGQHYVYTDGKTLYEDGKSVTFNNGLAQAIAVTDAGSYAVDYPNSNKLVINSKDYMIPGNTSGACNPACPYNSSLPLAIDDAGNNYILGSLTSQVNSTTNQLDLAWYVNGKQVAAPSNVESVEFVNGTPYIYLWQS